ncbi:calcium-binding protein [Sphingomonas lenta]|uniref:Calcium-binding protein n=1 Tax=Sphingomonas lenta TaxID=1141887 RepID=A0A2A2SG46_9SPHN|nr:calcium-binding protein [Sphingomonas lenta]PAX08227.1 calcium-binding protein [Sphingomonas lenta]
MLLLALALQAAPPAPPPSPTAQPPATILVEPAAMFFAACDANADALVTKAERDDCLARAYATAEGASAGRVGYIAYADWAQRWLGDRNALPGPYELDKDGDNRITAAELAARFTAIAARYDANGDSTLARNELVTIRSLPPGQGGPGRRRPERPR